MVNNPAFSLKIKVEHFLNLILPYLFSVTMEVEQGMLLNKSGNKWR
jgi:hypothetical protein